MSNFSKIALTVFIWLSTMIGFLATLAIASDTLGGAIIPIVVFLFGAAMMTNGFIWQWGNVDKSAVEQSEKKKRERLDTILRDMSDEDLFALKRRLSMDDFDAGEWVDEEGELRIGGKR